jgi:hypothetical protein
MNDNDKLQRLLHVSDLLSDYNLLVNGGKAKATFGDNSKWSIECEVTGQVLDCECFEDFKWSNNVLTVNHFGEVFDIELIKTFDFASIF